jgi:hypothetical protein
MPAKRHVQSCFGAGESNHATHIIAAVNSAFFAAGCALRATPCALLRVPLLLRALI